MPSKKPRVSPKKPDYDHSNGCDKYGTDKPFGDKCGRYHCRIIGGNSEKPNLANPTWSHTEDWNGPMTGKTTVSFNASCSCISPSCKMEHPDRRVLGRASTTPTPRSKCLTLNILAEREALANLVRTTLVEVSATVILTSIWLAAVLVGVTALTLSI